MISYLFLVIMGIAWGIAVGSALVAFLTVLGIVPRLAYLTKTESLLIHYEIAIILGSIFGIWISLGEPHLYLSSIIVSVVGLASGMFVGLVAAALTEVLNVLPILAKRIGMKGKINLLLWAIVLGKIIGSLYHWIFFVQ